MTRLARWQHRILAYHKSGMQHGNRYGYWGILHAVHQRATSTREGVSLEEFAQRAARNIPVGRMGTPAEFGAMAAFLASPLAGYITGTMIRLDGGSVRSI